MSWIGIEDAGIPEWSDNMTIDTIEKMTNGKTKVLMPFYAKDECFTTGEKLWYAESRDFLLKNGMKQLNDIQDCCPHEKLFWYENICRSGMGIKSTISPALLTIGEEVTLWAINLVENLHFRGCGLVKGLPKYIRYVRPLYRGKLSEENLNEFLRGIAPAEIIRHKFEPLPSEKFLEEQIISQNIKKWIIHNCSLCDYECGYHFRVENNDVRVTYDNGCYCASSRPKPRPLSDVIDHMKIQGNLETINKYKTFWGIQ